jgi:hypothetical protein
MGLLTLAGQGRPQDGRRQQAWHTWTEAGRRPARASSAHAQAEPGRDHPSPEGGRSAYPRAPKELSRLFGGAMAGT